MKLEDVIKEAQQDSVIIELCADIKKLSGKNVDIVARSTQALLEHHIDQASPLEEVITYIKYFLFIHTVALNIFNALKTKGISIPKTFQRNGKSYSIELKVGDIEDCTDNYPRQSWPVLIFCSRQGFECSVLLFGKTPHYDRDTWDRWYYDPAKSFKTMPLELYSHGPDYATSVKECTINDLNLQMFTDFVRDCAFVK